MTWYYIPHIITFLLCVLVVAIIGANLFLVSLVYKSTTVKRLLRVVLTLQLATIIIFVISQAIWVANNHGTLVGDFSQVAWIAYDYLNILYHLSVAVLINFYLRYKTPMNKGRRLTDS